MKNPNLYLPGFHLATLRRKLRLASQKPAEQLAEISQKSTSQLVKCFTDFIPVQTLQPHQSGTQSWRRLFSKENTFWGFFSQVLNVTTYLRCLDPRRRSHPCRRLAIRHGTDCAGWVQQAQESGLN